MHGLKTARTPAADQAITQVDCCCCRCIRWPTHNNSTYMKPPQPRRRQCTSIVVLHGVQPTPTKTQGIYSIRCTPKHEFPRPSQRVWGALRIMSHWSTAWSLGWRARWQPHMAISQSPTPAPAAAMPTASPMQRRPRLSMEVHVLPRARPRGGRRRRWGCPDSTGRAQGWSRPVVCVRPRRWWWWRRHSCCQGQGALPFPCL